MITEQEKQRRIEAAEKRVAAAKARIDKIVKKLRDAEDVLARESDQLGWISEAPTSD